MVDDKKEEKKKLETRKEEPEKEKREELSEELSKAAKDAIESSNYEKLGEIVKMAEANQIIIKANIKNTTDKKRSR